VGGLADTWWFLDGRFEGDRDWKPWAERSTYAAVERELKAHKAGCKTMPIRFRIVAGPENNVESRKNWRDTEVPKEYDAVVRRLGL